MKKKLYTLLIILISFALFIGKVSAKTANVYVFYGKTCPHCHEAMEYLDSIKDNYDFKTIEYEVWDNEENAKLMKEVAKYLDVNARGVPFVVIDNTPIIGYSPGKTDQTYIYHIKKANKDSFVDDVGKIVGIDDNSSSKDYNTTFFNRELNLTKTNIILSTIILGIKDGINLSMLWAILIVICLLANLRDKKKTLYIGITSIIISLILYLTLLIINKSFDDLLTLISNIRVILSVLLMLISIVGLIKVADNIDEEKIKINIPNKVKTYIGMLLSISIMIIAVLLGISNQGGVPNMINDIVSNNILLIVFYFTIVLIITFIIYLIIYKIFDILKLFEVKNKWTLIIASVIILIISIILGLHPNMLLFNL